MNKTNKPKRRNPNSLVVLFGLMTMAISLAIVYFLSATEFNIIGWFALFILPVGVGIVSGLGYFLGSKWTNSKIGKSFYYRIFFLSIVGFILSYYVTYLASVDPNQASFFEYLKFNAESSTFTTDDGDEGKPLGIWGWLFMGLEGLGFSIGSLVPVLFLSQAPYCDSCRYYLKKQDKRFICSPLVRADLKKKKGEEYKAVLVSAIESVNNPASDLLNLIQSATLSDTVAALEHIPTDKTPKTLARVAVKLSKCPACETHNLTATLTNKTTGDKDNVVQLFSHTNESPEG